MMMMMMLMKGTIAPFLARDIGVVLGKLTACYN